MTAMAWHRDKPSRFRLYLGTRLSGYEVLQDSRYEAMWRVRSPDGTLSDWANLTRAKDVAIAMLDRERRAAEEPREARPAPGADVP